MVKQQKFERFTTHNIEGKTYKFDRYLFLGFILFLIVFFLILLTIYGGLQANKNIFIECKAPPGMYCINELYNNPQVCGKIYASDSPQCTTELLPSGFTIGSRPPPIFAYFEGITFVGLFLIFLINHFKYNRGAK